MPALFDVDAKINAAEVERAFGSVAKDLRDWALADTMTLLAGRVKSNQVAVMKQRLDRPTPFTLGGLSVQPATPRHPVARIWHKDGATKGTASGRYLLPEAEGGQRPQKRMERALSHYGMLRKGGAAIPAPGAPLDAYGNVKRADVVRVLSALRAFQEQGYSANRSNSKRSQRNAAKNDFFITEIEGQRAIWKRERFTLGEGLKPIFWLVDSMPRYRVRYPFWKIAENTVAAHYDSILSAQMQRAVNRAGGRAG